MRQRRFGNILHLEIVIQDDIAVWREKNQIFLVVAPDQQLWLDCMEVLIKSGRLIMKAMFVLLKIK